MGLLPTDLSPRAGKYVDDSFVKDLKEVFQSMDANNDGQLTMDEITKGVRT